jgi:3-phosphoshikimate 1-carboxyvinyltransferase
VDATVPLPGSKSLTARYLVLAAQAASPTRLTGALLARDTDLMIEALRALGQHIDVGPDGVVDVVPGPVRGPALIDAGLAGTVMRFCLPLAALADAPVRLDGDPAARRRPMAGLIDAVRALGVVVDDDAAGHLPVTVHGTGGVARRSVRVDSSASSQFLSALLLAAPGLGGLDVAAVGAVPSRPHVEMTLAALRAFGAEVACLPDPGAPGDAQPRRWRVSGPLAGQNLTVEPDLSGAAPFLAAAVVTGGRVTVPGWPESTTQAGDLLRRFLPEFGAEVALTPAGLTVRGPARARGVDLDLAEAGELTPVLAAIATLAETPSRLTGIGHLRGHETDRLAALTAQIRHLGGRARELPDGLAIDPAPLHGGTVATYGDHRMAMFAAVIGLAQPGVAIRDVGTTAKTMADFPERWMAMVEGRW